MESLYLFDPASAALVAGGTLLGTLVRSGWRDTALTLRTIAALATPAFDQAKARATLAAEVETIRHDGLLRAQIHPVDDEELTAATAALARYRSVDALVAEHEQYRAARELRRASALRTLEYAAELGPVFGLIGTLIGLGQLPASGLDSEGAVMTAVSTAILTTLYGLLVAHLLILPLAGMIERRGRADEDGREHLIAWLAAQVGPACPNARTPAPAELAA
ncbi:MotA/TolQ/ExbB proton channel family protein [Altererythrobacter sp. H2]|uniref:MotA/TolQ/ExbB proton channel family protein n=1 Tax=Altererythrobacter sp. H2 TaxID=3108391 RepID=UPI002B4BE809|nr:MotA/TolQ/ExbB proton channel family protein [Altererythrobacter sp. H2]WRK95321.1 MotA/TolQ/ExbB proton channel family protein [Altererythrobacter sp. H2]